MDLRPGEALDGLSAGVNRGGMNVDLIRRRLSSGFRPFTLVTSSGDRYPVPHPEFVLLTRRTVVVADEDGWTTHLDPLHVVAIEDISAKPGKGNGRSKRQGGP